MVIEDNPALIGDNLFVTRLPFNYNEASRAVSEAVGEGQWNQVGVLNQTPTTAKRPAAHYSTTEKTVTLYDKQYRAVVVHSTAHDRRPLKRIDCEIRQSEVLGMVWLIALLVWNLIEHVLRKFTADVITRGQTSGKILSKGLKERCCR
jgi:hypothetical protein